MKNRLLPLLVVLGSYSAYSQVGIGTLNPDASAQLEVLAKNRGVLIPRVELLSSTDVTTIKKNEKGNYTESLLVFNINTISDVIPGYYYWYNNKWNRMAVSGESTGGSGGTASGEGIPAKDGQPGYPGKGVSIYTDTKTGIVYVQNSDGTWSSISGPQGIAGVPGVAGLVPSAGTTIVVDNTTGTVYILIPGKDPKDADSWSPINGAAGNNGKDGMIGGTGA
ncbi:hypothetical protein OIU83_23400, partial [Flavobacterium sp. LS1R49]|nr:hypothetical protein [Flavobacterium shii]